MKKRTFVVTYLITAREEVPESEFNSGVTPEGVAQISKNRIATEGVQRIAYAVTDIQVNAEVKR